MSEIPETTQVAVVGGGPGGYAAAFRAADLGLDVALIELEKNPGGTCLYRGCIPSKALLHVAKVLTEAREALNWGITFGEPAIDIEKMRARTYDVVEKLTSGLGQLCKARKIKYVRGRGALVDANTLKITADDGSDGQMHFEYAILAPGSRPSLLQNFLIDSPRIMTSTTALMIREIPESLLVIGGGYIGLELGSVYAALGTRVTVVEMGGRLLPTADADLAKILAGRMDHVMHEILLNTKVVGMEEVEQGVRIALDGPDVEQKERVFEKVLISIGRKPNSSGIGLKTSKVEVDGHGFIQVDGQRRTADPLDLRDRRCDGPADARA